MILRRKSWNENSTARVNLKLSVAMETPSSWDRNFRDKNNKNNFRNNIPRVKNNF